MPCAGTDAAAATAQRRPPRALLVALLALVRAPCPARAAPAGTCGLDCGSVYSESSLRACLGATKLPVVYPEDGAAYDYARKVGNARFWRRPAAVAYARAAADVSAAVRCAWAAGVRVSAAGGRHNDEGLAVPDGYLVVDTSNMTKVRVTRVTRR